MGIINNIKKEAIGKGTKIQSSEALQLEKLFNNLFYLEKDIEEETNFVRQVMTRGLELQERVGLHASAMLVGDNDFCIRAQVLSLLYKQSQGEQESPGLKRIFEQGNAIHEKWQRLMIRGGYGKSKDMDFTRVCKEYMLSYTPDGIIYIPDFFKGKMVLEIKSVNSFQFQKMTKHPSAWKQCQWYMHLCIEKEKQSGTWNGIDYTKGIVLDEDKNNQDFKLEVYDYDPLLVAPFIDRAEEIMFHYKKVINEHKMVKRPKEATKPDCKKCNKCFMKEACWNIGIGRIKID